MKEPTYSYKQACAAALSQPYGVNYRFTSGDGIQCHGRTVHHGRDQAHAERRFFRQHRHVSPVSDGTLNPDTN